MELAETSEAAQLGGPVVGPRAAPTTLADILILYVTLEY